ncbi:hypothetical protein [Candidatus Cetobacterium colombiensis]|uniref:Uncharacterized protein n=1 Tax=Candidatus Cetobacterium colombiensis TaxID=3073100 RepID=A0ABU4W796_9FUSO|nr:hypothetical protein [Candidatus Cetobacterium colombiensis]MDX8335104.1 hypothetical protein [Candidatus Cetobacterium colombiensis]
MKCKSCDGKMIKVSDLAFEEIENFLNNNPLKSLDRLENGDGVLVYYRQINPIDENEFYGNKIQFRKVEKAENNELKLFGFKNLFSLDNPTVVYGERLLYTLVPMNERYLKVLKDGLMKLDSNYSGTKLNNILKKSFMLEEFRRKYDGYIKKGKSTRKIINIDCSDEDFPF